jgi:hypothetical protein
MNHKVIRTSISFLIIAIVVSGVLYLQWPKRPGGVRSSSRQATFTTIRSLLGSTPEPVLGPPPADAAPTITWTPTSINQKIGAGQSKTVPVSFTASENISNVVVRVVPEIQTFVQVAPASFGSITSGQKVTVTVTIFASVNALSGTLDGTIQLRSGGNPPNNFAKPLPVTLMIQGLPPDPGAAGKATLQGIDSDSDGVRDDVQRHIALTYPNSERTRAGLTQYAKATQAALLSANDRNREATVAHIIESFYADECLSSFLKPEDARAISDDLSVQILNTDSRSRAWITASGFFSGEVFRSTLRNQRAFRCNFDPNAMGN